MTAGLPCAIENPSPGERSIKCVIWDLDNTIWDGVLLEDQQVVLRDNVVKIIRTLDERGILNSIASKNQHDTAIAKLEQFGTLEYFLYPQINWNSKVSSIQEIARSLNLGLDTIAFVDDQPSEREEVSFSIPEVLCIDALNLNGMTSLPEMNPKYLPEDSRRRRSLYLLDLARAKAEKEFTGSSEEYLATLSMVIRICSARKEDLERAEELTIRTHQLNTTGYTYSYEELERFRRSTDHKLLIAELDDKFGAYGKIGLALIDCCKEFWTIKLLLMSCRVMSRGVGTVMINYILSLAKAAGVKLQAEFISNERNRMMYVTYKFAGFKEVHKNGSVIVLENDLNHIQPFPGYLRVETID
jgi:FkbH-like protein